MSGTLVVLILGILVIAFLVYFTHTILRARITSGAVARPVVLEVRDSVRQQVADEARAASRRREPIADRAAREADDAVEALGATPKVRPSRCLWVDDDPDGIVHERRMLELLRVDIDLARSTNQALQFLVGRDYDVVITDLSRPVASGGLDDRAGIKLLKVLAGAPAVPPVIVYPDDVDPDVDPDVDADVDPDVDPGDDPGPMPPPNPGTTAGGDTRPPPGDPRLDDARAAGARDTVTSPSALLRAVLAVVSTS